MTSLARSLVALALVAAATLGCDDEAPVDPVDMTSAADQSADADAATLGDGRDGRDATATATDATADLSDTGAQDTADAPGDLTATAADTTVLGDVAVDATVDQTSDVTDAVGDTVDPPAPGWACDRATAHDDGGTAWDGWANVQFPTRTRVEPGVSSEVIYGQVWREGDTDQPGAAAGWTAELLVGPLGVDPRVHPACFDAVAGTYNVDVGNNDEYQASVSVDAPGVYALVWRFRPPGGQWRYADITGTDDGFDPGVAGVLEVVPGTWPGPLRVATLNLRCRLDDWTARRPLVLAALEGADPHLVGFQEDCLDPATGAAQAAELRALLGARTGRGYELHRVGTHIADGSGTAYDEGISLLSALPAPERDVLDVSNAVFPRKSLSTATVLDGQRELRVATTHFEFGSTRADVRLAAAQSVVSAYGDAVPTLIVGDLNATPEEAGVEWLAASYTDAWASANPGDPGHTFPADSPTRRIDYVFVDPTFATSVAAERLDEASGAVELSDHLGVAATLALD